MRPFQAIDAKRQADGIVGPAPALTLEQQADIEQPVDGGEGPRFRVAIVPAQTRPDAEVAAARASRAKSS